MTEQSTNAVKQREGRSRASVVIIASIVIFGVTTMALWALTTLGFLYALAVATPVTVVAGCGIAMVDAVAEFFAAILEALGAAVAAILAALAAAFSIFGG